MTAILGSQDSIPGSMILGSVVSQLPNSVTFKVLVYDSKSVLIRFSEPVDASSININSYTLLAVSINTYVPLVISADYHDASNSEVILTFSESLTFSGIYTLAAVDISNIDQTAVASMAYNFTATVPNKPKILGTYISDLNTIDVIFDRPIAPYNAGAIGSMTSSDSVTNPLSIVPWTSDYPENNLRFSFVTPAGDSPYVISLDPVIDISYNTSDNLESIVTTAFRLEDPVSSNDGVETLQIIDSFVSHTSSDRSYIITYFSAPILESSATDINNWGINQSGSHLLPDTSNQCVLPDPIDEPTLIAFVSDLRMLYNEHIKNPGIHNDYFSQISQSDLIKNTNSMLLCFQSHIVNDVSHGVLYDNTIVLVYQTKTIDGAISILNLLKASFETHRTTSGTHNNDDVFFQINSDDATDLKSAAMLADELLTKLRMHFSSELIHFLFDSNIPNGLFVLSQSVYEIPYDMTTCSGLIYELQEKYLSHISNEKLHTYSDDVNYFPSSLVSVTQLQYDNYDVSSLILASTAIRDSFNQHLSETYPLTIYSINNYSTKDVLDQFSYSCLIEISKSHIPELYLTCDVISDSSPLVSTNSGDYSGSITVRYPNSPKLLSSVNNTNGDLFLRFDSEIGDVKPEITSGSPHPVHSIVHFSSIQNMNVLISDILRSYSTHLDSSGHIVIDTVNIISQPDFPTGSLSSLITSLNNFKLKFNQHILNASYHQRSSDISITVNDAYDMESAYDLLISILHVFTNHDSDSISHTVINRNIISATVSDVLIIKMGGTSDSASYSVKIPVLGFTTSFTGISQIPVLASAIPVSGLDSSQMKSDFIDVFFSHPMKRTDVLSSNVVFSGGSLKAKRLTWKNNRQLSINVSNMTSSSYSLTITGLQDEFGNLIDPNP